MRSVHAFITWFTRAHKCRLSHGDADFVYNLKEGGKKGGHGFIHQPQEGLLSSLVIRIQAELFLQLQEGGVRA